MATAIIMTAILVIGVLTLIGLVADIDWLYGIGKISLIIFAVLYIAIMVTSAWVNALT